MTESLAYAPREVSPPGATLRDLMEEREWKQRELAHRMGRPVQAVNEIRLARRKSPKTLRSSWSAYSKCPRSSGWSGRRSSASTWPAAEALNPRANTCLGWSISLKALQDADVLPPGRLTTDFKVDLVEPMLRFFGVASPAGWKAHYDQMQPQFRRARPSCQTDVAAITAWLRMGELQAVRLHLNEYSAAKLQSQLAALRALSREPAEHIGLHLVRRCAEVGLALVFVPALPGTHVSGVARWLNGKPLIQLSLLGKWNDSFWFSFFHEVAHVLKHPTRAIFLDGVAHGDTVDSDEEQEANRFAADTLIPRALQPLLDTLALNTASIQAFAANAGVHPGIVVGQLQHRRRLGFATPLASLKDRYDIAR